MADESNTNTESNTAKPKTVADNMDSRRMFDTTTSAAAYIASCATDFTDFGQFDIASPYDSQRDVSGLSLDDEGNLVFDPEIFPADSRVMVSLLSTKTAEGFKPKAIVVAPAPTLDAILADTEGRKWLESKLDTEINRAAVRNLRDGKDSVVDVTDKLVLDQMPKTLSDYVTASRTGTSTLLEAFEEFWKPIKSALAKLNKGWKLANLPKREFKNAMSSAAYAAQYYPTLEDAALGKDSRGSLFVIALGAFIKEAEKAGKDSSIFKQWLNTRDEYKITESDAAGDDEDEEEELSADMLLAAMASAPAPDSEAPANQDGTGEGAEQGTDGGESTT